MNIISTFCFAILALVLFSSCEKDEPILEAINETIIEKRPSINDYIGTYDIEGFKLTSRDTVAFTNKLIIEKDSPETLKLYYLFLQKSKADQIGKGRFDGFDLSISQEDVGLLGVFGLAPHIYGDISIEGDTISIEYRSNACSNNAMFHFNVEATGVRR